MAMAPVSGLEFGLIPNNVKVDEFGRTGSYVELLAVQAVS